MIRMPDERTTQQLQPPPDWAIAMSQQFLSKLDALREDMCGHFDSVDKRIADLEETRQAHSDAVRGPSAHDLEAQAAIATERTERLEREKATQERIERIETKTDQQTKIIKESNEALTSLVQGASKVFADPRVRLILTAIVAAIASWLGAHK